MDNYLSELAVMVVGQVVVPLSLPQPSLLASRRPELYSAIGPGAPRSPVSPRKPNLQPIQPGLHRAN